jgi:hypothetical protein
MAWVMTALGEAPEILRNRPDTTSPFLHFLKVQCMASMRESVVDLSGCPPKWLAVGSTPMPQTKGKGEMSIDMWLCYYVWLLTKLKGPNLW